MSSDVTGLNWSTLCNAVHFKYVLFLQLKLAGGVCAMDSCDDVEQLRGFRFKWRKQHHDASVADAVNLSHSRDSVNVSGNAFCSGDHDISQPEALGFDVLSPDLGCGHVSEGCDESEQYEPSVAFSSVVVPPGPDPGGRRQCWDLRSFH